ncbi:MAG TPA: M28 family peptidase [Pyrinomonadaceae bacterium]|nr:M28 family peptidase [Pyrinomonadaceae bacterium]
MRSRLEVFRRATAFALAAILLLGCTVVLGWARPTVTPPPGELSAAEKQLAGDIKAETIRGVVEALSADDMQGRGTAQPGGDKAANYLAERFARLNLKPLGAKNSYLQPIKFKESEFLPETGIKIGDQTLKLGSDFVPTQPYSGDENASGPLFFIAYGLVVSALKRNDVAGLQLQGKIVVMLEGPPRNVSKDSWKKAHAQIDILKGLVGAGVAGLIFMRHGREERPYAEEADYLTRRQIERADSPEMPAELPPFASVSDEGADKLFAKSGTTRTEALAKAEAEGFKPIDLKQTAKIIVRFKKGKGVGNNVIGLMEGSDPNLKSEAVVFSAHYDAYGMTADKRIYHGAADNGLGVGEMIVVAEALARAATKPKRSVIFMAVTGEEYGGLGSDYWVQNPTWKIKQTAADLNLDGMGTEVYGPVKVIVGYGAEHSSLGKVLDEVAAAEGLQVIPDPMPDEHSFYRSDHYFFVKKGIPGIMLLGAPEGETKAWIDRMKQWEKTDYHQPTDTIRPEWNWEGPRMIAEVMAIMGVRVANDEKMPAWLASSPFNRERGTNAEPPPEP